MREDKLKIKEIKEKEIWENFLLECDEKTFLQSWNWGEFQKMMGNKIWRLGIFENGEPFSVALVIKVEARRGTFLFVPHGPNIKSKIKNQKLKILEILLAKLKEIAKEEKCDFIRIAPILERSEGNIKIFKNLGFREAPIHIHPELTWQLGITPSEENLLMQMRKTTRYLIRQVQKNEEIKIEKSNKIEDVEKFNALYQEVARRQNFVPFPLDYLKNEFLSFLPDNQISIFFGKYKGEVISSGIFIFWQGICFYHHGASSLKYPKTPVSYLLLWEAIKEAKKRGCQNLNFWGIAPITSDFRLQTSDHPWAGLTLFKMGFGGYKKEYLKTQDLPLSPKYWLTYFFEKMRKIKRGV